MHLAPFIELGTNSESYCPCAENENIHKNRMRNDTSNCFINVSITKIKRSLQKMKNISMATFIYLGSMI